MDEDIQYSSVKHTESKLFSGYRSLGHVSNQVPCSIRYIHKRRQNFIISCTGRTFNTYASQQLKLLTVCGTHQDEISCMAVDTYHVYTAARNTIFAWRRGTELKHTYVGHEADIICLLPFGEHLLSIDSFGLFSMYDIKTEVIVWSVQFVLSEFEPNCLMHPNTYINKILIGSAQGAFQLFNVRKAVVVHQFKGWESQITQIIQAPAVHMVAIGLADKRIVIFDLLLDEALMTLVCLDKPISLAFRMDGHETIIAGSDTGSLTVWDLSSQEISIYKQDAHRGPVTGLQSFHQEPIFVTSSSDNSVKVWIFDLPDGGHRLLNSREGHYKPSNRVKFYGSPAYNILSAGRDATFRTFHIYNETYSRCISKTKIPMQKLKMGATDDGFMPQIVDFTAESVTKPKHYPDVAACHENQLGLTTWSLANTVRAPGILLPKGGSPSLENSATCLCMSSCGQFVIAGYGNGSVLKFNTQSGIHRTTYGQPIAHEGSVYGVAVDLVNTTVVSGGTDRHLKFWDFDTAELVKEFTLEFGVSSFFFHRVVSLVGVVLDNCSIIIVDISSMKIFRRINQVPSPILSACFSPDNRWVTASTADCLVRTWDLTTSSLVDAFRLESIVSAMDYSPNGEFLATALHDTVGILLWMNKSLFAHVSLMPLPQDFEPPLLDVLPGSIDLYGNEEDRDIDYETPDQIDESLITLSLLPASKWKNLLNLDTIKMRNRPKEAPKTYVAPFFLSTLVPIEKTDTTQSQMPGSSTRSQIMQFNVNLSPFARKLQQIRVTPYGYVEVCQMLAMMGPSRIDSEFLALGPEGGGSLELLQDFLEFASQLNKSNKNFEGSQAYLALFLKMHGETIQEHEFLLKELRTVQKHMEERDEAIQNQITSVLAYTYFLKSTLFN